jgi:hypothetical protein
MGNIKFVKENQEKIFNIISDKVDSLNKKYIQLKRFRDEFTQDLSGYIEMAKNTEKIIA